MTDLHALDWMRVLTIALIGTLAWLGMRRLTRIVRRVIVRGEIDSDSEKRALTLARAVRCAAGAAVGLIVLMLLRAECGISIAPLPGAAGVAGIAFGLAAQGIANDFLRGFALLFDDQIPSAIAWRGRARRASSRK